MARALSTFCRYAKTATLHKHGNVMFSYLRERAVWLWHPNTGHLRCGEVLHLGRTRHA